MGRVQNAKALLDGVADPQTRRLLLTFLDAWKRAPSFECACCGYQGRFLPAGTIPRFNVECPQCGAFERHRLFWLTQQRTQMLRPADRVLHFAAESGMGALIRPVVAEYRTADLFNTSMDLKLNIESIDLPDASYDAVVCSHVLEHVDDRRALGELLRILTPGGRLIAMIPMVEGWDETYEDPAIVTEADRDLHYGQYDHVRFYGRDFRDRVRAAGFALTEHVAGGVDSVRYGLLRGERVFVATKP